MSGKQFDQQQKAAIVENAKEIGFKEASRIAGVATEKHCPIFSAF